MIRPILLLTAILGLAGCEVLQNQQSAAPALYVLKAEASGTVPSTAIATLPAMRPAAIVVSPTALPEFLDRAEFVERDGSNLLKPVDGHRWGERLGVGVTRVVAENLQRLLPRDLVTPAPGRGRQAFDFEVGVDISRFALSEGGQTEVTGRWTVLDAESGKILASEQFAERRPAGSGYDGQVSAMNANLAAVSSLIARAIAALPPPVSP